MKQFFQDFQDNNGEMSFNGFNKFFESFCKALKKL
jgi:hypothetical protein